MADGRQDGLPLGLRQVACLATCAQPWEGFEHIPAL
ncbi:protein of unknown function [Candidatus Filomicrobium marinum]|uniref:Uncharacterized protein n=1 Tax=Candidatus Filomicrobium marinum TaxID=1608628 RepID=A0A0D6JIR0_9HYPH|nr:protein of unknown function [Candidatus Filomicrobium marinum]CPR21826.1 protein of unknown function [Candidatus Filomicrobium marinum]